MREFISSTTSEELISDTLGREPVDDIRALIDIGNIPYLLRRLWDDVFDELFDYPDAMDIRSAAGVIRDGRNRSWGHPGVGDFDIDFTRVYLFLIADVLKEIGKLDAKREVENIRDQLFSHEDEAHIADVSNQLETARAENAELEKSLKAKSDRLEEVEAERATYEKRLETASFQLKIAVAGKTVAEERLSDTSNRLEEVEAENAAYKKRRETIQGQLEAANAEKTLKAASNRSATEKKKSAELEDLLERLKEDVKVEAERQNEKVVAPKPAPDFPYTGSQLRDYRQKAGLTQVAVALALGLSEGSAAAVSDWEVEREKVPPKHYTKLKKLYGLEVLPGNGKARKKKTSIAERYAAETTEEERNELAVKVAELRINEEGTKGLAWRKIREELGLKNDEFHKVIRHEDHYKESCIQRIESFEGGWEYGGKLEDLLGFDPVGELLDRIEACKPASKVWEPAETEDPKSEESQADEDSGVSGEVSAEVPSYRGDTVKSPKSQRKWRRPGAVAALRDPAEIREAEAKIANILNPGEKTRLELELREAKRVVYGSEI